MGIFRTRITVLGSNFCYNTRMNDSIQCEEFWDDREEQWIIEFNQASDQETITK